jgi:integrase
LSRANTGTLTARTLADGTKTFYLRISVGGHREREILHERRRCDCGCGGGWTEATARIQLNNLVARAGAGVWRKREHKHPAAEPARCPTFHEYASYWLQAKKDGVIGDRPIEANTQADYLWRLRGHLLPFFGTTPLDEIDRELCLRFKAAKLREAAELREALDAGAVIRDRRGRRERPLGPASIKKLIDTLAAILDEAVEDGHLERNLARGRRMRVRAPKPTRTFLEMDELVALLDAAGEQDGPAPRSLASRPPERPQTTRTRVADLLAQGERPNAIARELGLSKAAVSYHVRRLEFGRPGDYVGRRALVATLGYSGVRVSELCDMRVRHLRLHDPGGARFHIPDAKTEAGVREVQISPELVEHLVGHLDRLRRAGRPTGPDAYVFSNVRSGRLSRQRAAEIVREAAARATESLVARGLPPLPRTTPHSLRRTYISIALLATGFDVLFVMSQVGHADSKMTTDVYAQLQQRVKRDHGSAFDGLVARAREQLRGASSGPHGAFNRTTNRTTGAQPLLEDLVEEWADEEKEPE